jgi:nitronate monooxygenase
MFPDTRISKLLRIEYPIIQAPMAGGPTTPELATAVSNAGGLGTLAGGMLSPDAIRQAIAEVRSLTLKPFGMNLFLLDTPHPAAELIAKAMEVLNPIRIELGLSPEDSPAKFCEDFPAQFNVLLEMRPALASFTFGILDEAQIAALHAGGTLVCGTATTVAEACAWETVGADMVCAQGSEAGGHRGTFLGDYESALVGTMALVPQMVDAVRIPVIAAGGIMDGRGIAAAHMLGASGVQMGTAFMRCPEAGTSLPWRNALQTAKEDQTRVSRVYSGKPARGLINEFMRRLSPFEKEIPPYPIQNALTGSIRRAAVKADRPEFLSLWAGQGAGMCRDLPAGDLVRVLEREAVTALQKTAAS